MNGQMPNNMLCKIKDCANKLCSTKLTDSLDFSMSVTSRDKKDGSLNNCFYKRITSDTEVNVAKMLIAVGAVGLTAAMVCALCCAMGNNKKK